MYFKKEQVAVHSTKKIETGANGGAVREKPVSRKVLRNVPSRKFS
jgi:hypothetical protein